MSRRYERWWAALAALSACSVMWMTGGAVGPAPPQLGQPAGASAQTGGPENQPASARADTDVPGAAVCSPWTIVPAAGGNHQGPGFLAVAALGPADAWAVGERLGAHGYGRTYAQHWDGARWSHVATPRGGSNSTFLAAVAVISSTDAWTVGGYNGQQALSEHWNGINWTVVPVAPVGTFSVFKGVTALSSRDVWAVGNSFSSAGPPYGRTLIEHWDGARWSVVPSPNPGPQDDSLFAVTALDARHVWAVGLQAPDPFTTYTLVEQWDGTQWRVVPSPNPTGSGSNGLVGAAAITPRDVWAVGSFGPTLNQSLIEHWNGQSWVLRAGAPITQPTALAAVAGAGPDDVWIVGASGGTLTEHRDGAGWTRVPSPDPGLMGNTLAGVAGVPGTGAFWAVGYDYTTTGLPHPLILHTDGCGAGAAVPAG